MRNLAAKIFVFKPSHTKSKRMKVGLFKTLGERIVAELKQRRVGGIA